jgi:Protein of unknown function (DUF3047)
MRGRLARLLMACACALGPGWAPVAVCASETPADVLTPLQASSIGLNPGTSAPWNFAGLPGQTFPPTRFSWETVQGEPVLRVASAGSYGNLLHRLSAAPACELSWRWRVEQPLARSDLRTRQGDDVALKVCALFDMPRDRVPFVERQLLRLAESRVGEPLPNATICYAWDPSWPADSVVPNVYSRRVRYITLGTGERAWQAVRRDLAADFKRAFGDESPTVPSVSGIAIGADADNTGGQSLGYVADVVLRRTPGCLAP